MKVAVIRHAIAEDRATFARTGQDDGLRPLTPKGRNKMRKAAQGLKRILPDIELIGSSPLVRALETARIVADCYGSPRMVKVPELAPGVAPEGCLDWLRRHDGDVTVALVGHEPDLGSLVGWLLTGRRNSFMEVKKGSVCLLEFPGRVAPGGATLLWFLKPSQLALIGEAAG